MVEEPAMIWVELPCCICGKATMTPDPQSWSSHPPTCGRACRVERKRIAQAFWAEFQATQGPEGGQS